MLKTDRIKRKQWLGPILETCALVIRPGGILASSLQCLSQMFPIFCHIYYLAIIVLNHHTILIDIERPWFFLFSSRANFSKDADNRNGWAVGALASWGLGGNNGFRCVRRRMFQAFWEGGSLRELFILLMFFNEY
ncbi:MAG: hypothetical protein PHU25_06885 [Deltaproteobacteria bacterium]|nr:hypothetical protein [Deltaproteobacteria bacterium]